MPMRFDDAIPFGDLEADGYWVVAIGPVHPREKIKEICVWVYQPREDGKGDAAATEMTTHTEADHGPHFLQIEGQRWLLPLKKISTAPFRSGRAFAVALALIAEREGEEKERVEWWGQPVELQAAKELTTVAVNAVRAAAERINQVPEQELAETLGEDGPFAGPLEFKGTS
jgi:4-alpha-glucanotransferase